MEKKSIKLKNIQKQLNGQHVIVVSCGPSMLQWNNVRNRYPNAKVICVKQSVEVVGQDCDILFTNYINLKKYRNVTHSPYVIYGFSDIAEYNLRNFDFKYVVISDNTLKNSISAIKSLDKFEIAMSFGESRPWGPGIMYEAVFPFLAASNVKKITTVGWDIADNNGKNTHYYDAGPMTEFDVHPIAYQSIIKEKLIKYRLTYFFLRKTFKLIKFVKAFVRYHMGCKVNFAGMQPQEAELVSASIPMLRKWLCSKNIELEIVSSSVWMNNAN